jgi:hypothetical protein
MTSFSGLRIEGPPKNTNPAPEIAMKRQTAAITASILAELNNFVSNLLNICNLMNIKLATKTKKVP